MKNKVLAVVAVIIIIGMIIIGIFGFNWDTNYNKYTKKTFYGSIHWLRTSENSVKSLLSSFHGSNLEVIVSLFSSFLHIIYANKFADALNCKHSFVLYLLLLRHAS